MKSYIKESGFSHILIVALLVVVSIVGFAGWRVFSSNSSDNVNLSQNEDESSDEISEIPEDISGILSVDEIKKLAGIEKDIVNIELENEDGTLMYKVYYSDGTTKYFNATDGIEANGEYEVESEDEDSEAIPKDFTFGITIQEAVNIAKRERPNSRVEKVEIEFEDGVVVYSVRFTDDSRVDVNASDGSVERVRAENSDNDDDDDEDEDDDEEDDDDDDEDEEDEDDDEEDDEEDDEDDDDRR